MKVFIQRLIGFGIVAILFYVTVLFVWALFLPKHLAPNVAFIQGAYGHMNTRMKEVKQVKDIDILFLGSSHAYRDLDPRIFKNAGFSSFNLGSSAQTPDQTKVLVSRYLEQLNPRLVVLELSPKVFSKDGVESALDIISNDKNDLASLKMAWNLKNMKVLNTWFYASVRQFFGMDKGFTENRVDKEDTYIPGGFVEKKRMYFEYQELPKETLEFNSSLQESLEEMILIFQMKQIEYVLVSAPIAKATYESYTENEKFDRTMESFGPYFNFNEIMQLDDSLYFYNAQHLNQDGVQLFNEKLIEVIDKHLPKD